MLLGVSAPAAIVSHPMVPAAGESSRYEYLGSATELGMVKAACQLADRSSPLRPFCYGPDQIRSAYGVQPLLDAGLTGAGRSIVIIDAYQSPTIRQDLALFDQLWGCPNFPPTQCKHPALGGYPDPTLNIYAPDGLTAYDVNNANMRSWAGEISLDVEWAHAIAPRATINLVLAKSNQDADILSVTKWALDNHPPLGVKEPAYRVGDVISQSFGEAEACADPDLIVQEHAVFEAAHAKGMTLFASSGDQGATQLTCDGHGLMDRPATSTPASDPLVTGVGGTHLLAGTCHVGTPPVAPECSGEYGSESAWNDLFGASGGGFSNIYRRPVYQAPFQPNDRQRGVPDVAYNGDLWGGVLVVWGSSQRGPGGLFRFGGTSAGSPQWAGIVAIADQIAGRRLASINTRLYHIAMSSDAASALHDIADGNNSWGGVTGFSAAPRWDAVTGLGTPNAVNLIPLLIGRPGEQ